VIVEADILVRHPLAEYLRECGYRVLEAADAREAREILAAYAKTIEVVLADYQPDAKGGFVLARWIRANHPRVKVILTGSVSKAARTAGDICKDGPAVVKPFGHQAVLDRIRRLLAARERRAVVEGAAGRSTGRESGPGAG
jgi:DNA-binding response OmpR family regulator